MFLMSLHIKVKWSRSMSLKYTNIKLTIVANFQTTKCAKTELFQHRVNALPSASRIDPVVLVAGATLYATSEM